MNRSERIPYNEADFTQREIETTIYMLLWDQHTFNIA